ncbi:uncharacterized protein [Sagmatias obliquidens]|uniref:uncharacterized protein n=1 Tax=Sagmatias obliquidens TaxID=3371155 RepID=UPI000F440B82|nr:uncharacterized protein LOC113625935 [Lagenorhynchus obliquidens]
MGAKESPARAPSTCQPADGPAAGRGSRGAGLQPAGRPAPSNRSQSCRSGRSPGAAAAPPPARGGGEAQARARRRGRGVSRAGPGSRPRPPRPGRTEAAGRAARPERGADRAPGGGPARPSRAAPEVGQGSRGGRSGVPSPALGRRGERAPGAEQAGADLACPSPSPPSRRRGGWPGSRAPGRSGRCRRVRGVPRGPGGGMRPGLPERHATSRLGAAGAARAGGRGKNFLRLPASARPSSPGRGSTFLPEGIPVPRGPGCDPRPGFLRPRKKGSRNAGRSLPPASSPLKQGVEKSKCKDKWPG